MSRLIFVFDAFSKSLFFFILTSILFSCGTTSKDLTCFKTLKTDTSISKLISNNFESKIQKSDVLSISVSSLNKELDDRFNTVFSSNLSNSGTIIQEPGYQVSNEGFINIHYLGLVKAEGLTRNELKEKLEKDMAIYLKEPIVNIKYLNRKITIIGEVGKPQVLYMPEEQLSVIDAIVISGDFKENANTNDLMVIRDSLGAKNIKHINLQDHSVFTSSYYYLKPNDILYVSKDYKMLAKVDKKKDVQTNISLALSVTSLVVLIFSLLRK